MDERRRKGLCYNCEEKWNPSHVCKNPRIYLLQVDGVAIVNGKEQEGKGEIPRVLEIKGVTKEENLEISIHAISSSPSNNIMRLLELISTLSVEILVDSSACIISWNL